MKVLIFGAAGFIGTNLTKHLLNDTDVTLTLVDGNISYFGHLTKNELHKVHLIESKFTENTDFDELVKNQDIVYHLVSTTVPTTSNQHIPDEIVANVVVTAKLLDACVRCGVKKVIFVSSGGTVYGKDVKSPISEESETLPISSYGLQKLSIEKLLYLYSYMYGLDYRVIRLANPYGPYQRPNGVLGAVTTFTYKALNDEPITVYGDGTVVRDFIYIEDAVRAIRNISTSTDGPRIYNVGSGTGTSIKMVLDTIAQSLNKKLEINYIAGRKVDVPINYLNIDRYVASFGNIVSVPLDQGILKTAKFLQSHSDLK